MPRAGFVTKAEAVLLGGLAISACTAENPETLMKISPLGNPVFAFVG